MSDQVQESAPEVAGGEPSTESTGGAIADGAGGVTDPLFADGPFSWKYDKGEHIIKNRRELADAFRHSYMNRASLDAERQKLAQQRKLMDQAIQKARSEQEANTALFNKYRGYESAFGQHPDLKRRIEQMIDEYKASGGRGSSDQIRSVLEAELKPIKDEFGKWQEERKRQAEEEQWSSAAEQLAAEIEGFDGKAAREFLDTLRGVPEADAQRKLMEIAHFALLGQQRASDLEKRPPPTRARPNVTSTPGKPTSKRDVSGMNEAEKHAYAVELLKASGD